MYEFLSNFKYIGFIINDFLPVKYKDLHCFRQVFTIYFLFYLIRVTLPSFLNTLPVLVVASMLYK